MVVHSAAKPSEKLSTQFHELTKTSVQEPTKWRRWIHTATRHSATSETTVLTSDDDDEDADGTTEHGCEMCGHCCLTKAGPHSHKARKHGWRPLLPRSGKHQRVVLVELRHAPPFDRALGIKQVPRLPHDLARTNQRGASSSTRPYRPSRRSRRSRAATPCKEVARTKWVTVPLSRAQGPRYHPYSATAALDDIPL